MAVSRVLPDIKPAVLVVDDDDSMRDILMSILRKDYDVYSAASIANARHILQNYEVQIVLLDVRLNQENGLTLLPEIKEINEQIEVIVITVITDVKTAVQAMKLGAFDYINKDFDYDEVRAMVGRAIQKQQSTREIICLREEIRQQSDDE